MAKKPCSIAPCGGHHFTHSTPPLFIQLLPSEIRYTRLSVSPRLSSGLHVLDLLRRCLVGDITVGELTRNNGHIFTVIESGDKYWALDGNKRLWVLKELEKLKLCRKVSVRVKRRRDYGLWDRIASTACDGKEVEFTNVTDSDRFGFAQKAKEIMEEFQFLGSKPFTPKPATSRFLWAEHPTPAQIMTKRVDDSFRNCGNFQWYRGPYNVERPIVLGFILLFFFISLSVLGKARPDLEVE